MRLRFYGGSLSEDIEWLPKIISVKSHKGWAFSLMWFKWGCSLILRRIA